MTSRSTCVVASDKTSITSHTNYRYLSTPEKNEKLKQLHKASRAAKMKVERLKEKLKKEIDKEGVTLETLMTADLHEIMKEEEHQALTGVEDGSFQQLFWNQQKEAAARKDKRVMRWHPAMFKWCLFFETSVP